MRITNAVARKILNSNSNFTVEVEIRSNSNIFKGSAPAGESTSKYEIQDNLGINAGIEYLNSFLKEVKGLEISTLQDIINLESKIPRELIGSYSLALEYALLKLVAKSNKKEVYELFNQSKIFPNVISKVIGGGVHALGKGMDFQEILVTTEGDFDKSLNTTLSVYKKVKELLENEVGFYGGVDPEGGFISNLSTYDSLKLVRKAIDEIKKLTGEDIRLGIDAAASQFFNEGYYHYKNKLYGKDKLNRGEQVDAIIKLINEFDIFFVEDPVDQDYPEGYREIKNKTKSIVIGDDLTATDINRLERFKEDISGALIKPNQQGLISKSIAFSNLIDKYNLVKVFSHRSEETNEYILADLAVGMNAKLIKIGINRGERIEKINRLSEIWKRRKN
ncbi:MAG: hypothetical protein QXX36_02430 [Candidatus Rehaiarchaeum fermentans]|nr:hypothetical protein [Candidatus Rehaiarchaeum fermentans]